MMNTLNYRGIKDNMPCNCEHMEPRQEELESIRVAKLLVYVHNALHVSQSIDSDIIDTSNAVYGNVDLLQHHTQELCKLCRAIEFDSDACHIIYNGRSKQARKLADWWDSHKEFDKKEGR